MILDSRATRLLNTWVRISIYVKFSYIAYSRLRCAIHWVTSPQCTNVTTREVRRLSLTLRELRLHALSMESGLCRNRSQCWSWLVGGWGVFVASKSCRLLQPQTTTVLLWALPPTYLQQIIVQTTTPPVRKTRTERCQSPTQHAQW